MARKLRRKKQKSRDCFTCVECGEFLRVASNDEIAIHSKAFEEVILSRGIVGFALWRLWVCDGCLILALERLE